MKKLYSVLLSVLLLTVFSGCFKDTIEDLNNIKGVQATATFTAPLISSSLSLKDIYESYSKNALIKEQSDHLLVFIYRAEATVNSDTLIKFDATSSDFDFQMTPAMIAIFQSVGSFGFSIDDSLKLPNNRNEQIKRVIVKNGQFSVAFESEYKHNISVTIKYPFITKNGVPVEEVVNVNYDPNDYPKKVTHILKLEGYEIDFTRGGITTNTIPFVYDVQVTQLPGNPTLTTEKLSVNQTFYINEYSLIEGYLGRFTILDEPQKIDIDLFENSIAGQVFLANPRLVIRLYNTFGVPVTGTISELQVKDYNGLDFPVIIAPFQDTFSFAHPSAPGQIGVSEFIIDRNNSNIDDVINSRPKQISFRIKAEGNYRQEVTNNFITDTSLFKVDFDSEIPFDIKIIDYVSQSKADNGTFSEMPENVQSLQLHVKTENKLPFDLMTQMIFSRDSITPNQDTIPVLVDSLFNVDLYIPGGEVDQNGEVVASTVRLNTLTLPLEKYERIKNAQYQTLRLKANSSQFGGASSYVKVRTNLTLDMKIGGDIKLTYKTK